MTASGGATTTPRPREGGCHCGAVRFRVTAPLAPVLDCNCSICRMRGYLHWIVGRDQFEVLRGEGDLATYRFGTGKARHHFCTTCGITPFYIARSHPDQIDVNARCVDGLDLGAIERVPFDGENWEQSYARLHGETDGDDSP